MGCRFELLCFSLATIFFDTLGKKKKSHKRSVVTCITAVVTIIITTILVANITIILISITFIIIESLGERVAASGWPSMR